jgi:hypothetical protein
MPQGDWLLRLAVLSAALIRHWSDVMNNLGFMLQIVIAGVFIVSATSKLWVGEARNQFVYAVDVLGFRKPSLVAKSVTGFEVLIALMCLVPGLAIVGLCGALIATLGFTVAIARAMRSGVRVACPCFGPSGMPLGPVHIVRNAVIAAIALAALLLKLPPDESVSIDDAIGGIAVGAIIVFIISTFDTLLTLPTAAAARRQNSFSRKA